MNYPKTLNESDGQEFITWIDGYTIRINKVGGGTLGRSYSGEYWEYEVSQDDKVLLHAADMYLHKGTHLDAALFAHIGVELEERQ